MIALYVFFWTFSGQAGRSLTRCLAITSLRSTGLSPARSFLLGIARGCIYINLKLVDFYYDHRTTCSNSWIAKNTPIDEVVVSRGIKLFPAFENNYVNEPQRLRNPIVWPSRTYCAPVANRACLIILRMWFARVIFSFFFPTFMEADLWKW